MLNFLNNLTFQTVLIKVTSLNSSQFFYCNKMTRLNSISSTRFTHKASLKLASLSKRNNRSSSAISAIDTKDKKLKHAATQWKSRFFNFRFHYCLKIWNVEVTFLFAIFLYITLTQYRLNYIFLYFLFEMISFWEVFIYCTMGWITVYPMQYKVSSLMHEVIWT